MELSFEERRVLGTLIEKGYTTPEQYPLTINSLVVGSNQKSCRNPMSSLDEEKVFRALDGLRQKGLCTLIQIQGSRTDRWKHRVADTLGLEDSEIAVLGELLLRGPQTDGEIRQHASRMVRIESLESLSAILSKLMTHDPAFVVRLTPEGRKRGVRYAHNLYPRGEVEELKEQEASAASAAEEADEAAPESGGAPGGAAGIRLEIEVLRAQVSALETRLRKLEEALGN